MDCRANGNYCPDCRLSWRAIRTTGRRDAFVVLSSMGPPARIPRADGATLGVQSPQRRLLAQLVSLEGVSREQSARTRLGPIETAIIVQEIPRDPVDREA